MIIVKEIGLRNKEYQFDITDCDISNLLEDIYGERVRLLINEEGVISGYINVYVNKKNLENIKNVKVCEGDEVVLMSSMSGG